MMHSRTLLALAALLCAEAAQATHIRYMPTVWRRADVVQFEGMALNDAGQVAGRAVQSFAPPLTTAAITRGSDLVDLALLRPRGTALGLNGLGHAVGYDWNNDPNDERAFWTDGQITRRLLAVAGSGRGRAYAVDDSGRVVGQSRTFGTEVHATLWENGFARQIASFGGTESVALSVNTAGHAVGWADNAQGRRRAFLYDGNQTLDLGTLGGATAEAMAINNRGAVVGGSNLGAFTPNLAFVWRNGQMQRLGDWDNAGSTALAINDAGLAVGTFSATGGNRAFVAGVAGMHDLNHIALPDAAPGDLYYTRAMGINAHGQILAQRSDGETVLLTPEGRLSWGSLTGGRFADGARWDSGFGQGPSRFLDMGLTSRASQTVVLDENVHTRATTIGSAEPGAAVMTLQLSRGAVLGAEQGVVIERSGVVTGDGGLGGNVTIYGTIQGTGQSGRTFQDRTYVFDVQPLQNHGLVSGSGRFDMDIANRSGGTVRAGLGESAHIHGASHTSEGSIEVLGGELRWTGELRNAGRGVIRLNDGTIRFDDGLVNNGQVHISFGGADVFGAIENRIGARIIASGGSEVTFWEGVTNHGEIRASAGSHIVYFGAVDGVGQFTTNGDGAYHRFEGGFGPGPGPGGAEVGDAQVASRVTMQIGGLLQASEHDHVDFTGSLSLDDGAALRVAFVDGFSAHLGDRFDLFDYRVGPVGVFGSFNLARLDRGLAWDLSTLYDDGVIRVVAVPEPSTYALMLAGLAACGWVARRSRPGPGAAGPRLMPPRRRRRAA